MISLPLSLIRREITGRYRGSTLGLIWSLLTPLFMLAVYTFVFGYVLKARWTIPGGTEGKHSTAEFAVILFAGLVVFQLFAEVVGGASGLVLQRANYVKKVVFPLQILPVVSTGAALFHTGVSTVVLFVFVLFGFGQIPGTALLAPAVIAPLGVMVLGLAWFLAAVGVYFRDIGNIVPPLLTALMFLSPIFFPRTALPEWLQPYLSINPLAIPVEAFRAVTVFGEQPDWTALAVYLLVAVAIAWLGFQFFQKTRKGFADVL